MKFQNKELRLYQILTAPHVSEKSTLVADKTNTIVFKVIKSATKKEIKTAVESLFEVKVEQVRTLINKGKQKRHGAKLGKRSDWKKAYVTLSEGADIDFAGINA